MIALLFLPSALKFLQKSMMSRRRTERGADGRRGRRFARRNLSFTIAGNSSLRLIQHRRRGRFGFS
jgi:hypothetical protein